MPNANQREQPTPSDWAALVEVQREQADEFRIIKAGYKHFVEQMAEITVTLHAQDRRIAENAKQLQEIGEGVKQSAKMGGEQLALLQDVRDAVTTATALSRAAKWVGGLVIATSAVWLAIKDLFVGGKHP